jgi:hypothetical protein
MDRIDRLQAQIDALAQQTAHWQHQTQALEAQTRTLARHLRWWRGLAGGMLLLGLCSWMLSAGTSADAQSGSLADRMNAFQETLTALQTKLAHLTSVTTPDGLTEVVITGANLRIVNGLGSTDNPNGLGNLIVGYNEPHNNPDSPDVRTGSHNVVVGQGHNFSRFGGVVVGQFNEISGDWSAVSGGLKNTASGSNSAVSGGRSTRRAAIPPRSAAEL